MATKEKYVSIQHSESTMKDKNTLSQQIIFKSRQTQHEVEVKFVATKTATVATEVEKKDT